MRPSRLRLRVMCSRLARCLGLLLFAGLSACGSPPPEAPLSAPTSGSTNAVVAIPTGDASRAARQVPTLTSPLGPPAPAAERRSPDAPRATSRRAGAARGPGAVVRRVARVSGRHGPAPGAGTVGAAAGYGDRSTDLRAGGRRRGGAVASGSTLCAATRAGGGRDRAVTRKPFR